MKSVAEFLVILVVLYDTVNTTKQIFYPNVWKNNFSPLPQFPTLYLERKQCFLTEHIQILGEKYYHAFESGIIIPMGLSLLDQGRERFHLIGCYYIEMWESSTECRLMGYLFLLRESDGSGSSPRRAKRVKKNIVPIEDRTVCSFLLSCFSQNVYSIFHATIEVIPMCLTIAILTWTGLQTDY